MPFSNLGLSDQLVQGILATGYTAPTDIQLQAIPLALAGRDIIGCAQTGTGKTAAFALPMLHHLTKTPGHGHRHTRALVLTPTRELAQQVEDFVSTYGRFTSLQSLSVYGGVSMENQIKRLHRGVDIVIATPGRLLDHINRKTIDLSRVEVLVLDEADRMFDMGFIHDVRTIISRVPVKRQTLLFSATMSKEVKALVASIQHNPELIEVGEQQRPVDAIRETFYTVEQEAKLRLLLHILATQTLDSVLVFSRTKHGADKISRRLEKNGVKAIAIHANRTQAQRQRALAGFKQRQYTVLVATDIAARGIDVEGISHVINFDTPAFAEDYVHRIGRTGRASLSGDAITFVSGVERKYLKSIEFFVGKKYEVKRYPGFDYTKPEAPPAAHGSEAAEKSPHQKREPQHHQPRQHDKPHEKRQERQQTGHTSHTRNQHRRNDRQDQSRGQSPRPGRKFSDGKRRVAQPPVPVVKETDWKKLLDEGKGERDSFRKRLKKLFKRG
jgi:ATP-dependent RNA helicase RhlE